MRLVIQRTNSASVSIDGSIHASIGKGLLILLGIEEADGDEDTGYLVGKICAMRIFADAEGKMNLDVKQAGGEIMVVSQFTLHASTKKGNRPSFIRAARPQQAIPLYEGFISKISQQMGRPCAVGVFGADMQVALVNDGPVTIILDSKSRE